MYHNFYGEDWGNVVAFLNLKYGPAAGVTVYTDLAVDDLTAPTEAKDQSAPPPAFGALLGASWRAEPATGAYIETTLEAAYVSPTFAFRDKPLQGTYARIMYLDNTAGRKRVWVDYPLCYYLGNDLIDGGFTRIRVSGCRWRKILGYAGYHFLAKVKRRFTESFRTRDPASTPGCCRGERLSSPMSSRPASLSCFRTGCPPGSRVRSRS